MADLNIKNGCTVQTQDGREGTVRYIGPLHIAAGEWLGLELPDNTGKNDGSVKGQRYFQCAPGFGIFVRRESAVKVVKQPSQGPRPSGNGSLTKPRPSSGVTADVARKRQSLMSAGSAAGGGARLSMRSPTKSPTKMVPSSATSTTSTPRSGTPATTARTSDSSTKSRLSTGGRTLMGPPATTTSKTSAAASRMSVGGGVRPSSTKPSSAQPRAALAGSRLSMSSRGPPRDDRAQAPPTSSETLRSPPIQEEPPPTIPPTEEASYEPSESSVADLGVPASTAAPKETNRVLSSGSNLPGEDKSRHTQVIKALETKVRTLQKQRQEDQARLQTVQELESQTTRYESIIQTLREKLKTNLQEIQELRAKYEDAESRAEKVPDKSAEQESELELATLDKEMAEERAEMFEAELEALKLKHEELELEAEILREENRELTSVMSPEEKASAGWLQLERETERLRQALVMLRDMSQQNESDLKNEIKELQQSLDEHQGTASKYDELVAKLNRSEETNQHLREQLEAAEANDDMLEVMAAERDQDRHMIEMLKRQVQDLEEHVQVTDELEAFHVDEEKRLHYQLNEVEAMLNEKQRQTGEQEKMIEDLEYTLTKFRDMVQGLQSDINELRRSREISELEAHEMSSKSRAMMDLNLKLQNSASKTQLKAIDLELGKMRAEQANLHLEIVQSFVPESFDVDKRPILALLCFKRIKSKAVLGKTILAERVRDRPELLQDHPMSVFAIMERMSLIANLCDRFVQHMSNCSPAEFMRYGGAPFELEPVEHTMTGWIEALRRDELASEGPEHLQRMAGILVDMAEKVLPENHETKAMQLLASIAMVGTYTENIAGQAQVLDRAVQARLGSSTGEDETSRTFEKRIDLLGIKARTVKYISSKVGHALEELQARSMCMAESTWSAFAEAELCAESASRLTQQVGNAVLDTLNNRDEREVPLSYNEIMDVMAKAAQASQQEDGQQTSNTEAAADFFDIVTKQLQLAQTKVDDLHTRSADVSSAIEFEKLPAPWVVRAKEVKAQKVLSQDLQEEMALLRSKIQEQSLRIGEKDKQLEEQQVRVELLEARAKETKVKDDAVRAMKEEIERLRAENAVVAQNLRNLETEYQTMLEAKAVQETELEGVKQRNLSNGDAGMAAHSAAGETVSARAKAEIDLLNVEIASLQASVRFLKYENYQLRIPVGQISSRAAEHAWLDPGLLKSAGGAAKDDRLRRKEQQRLREESKDMFVGLIELAKAAKPIRFGAGVNGVVHAAVGTTTTAAAAATTTPHSRRTQARAGPGPGTAESPLYKILRYKEELERWTDAKDDLVRRARVMVRVRPTPVPIQPIHRHQSRRDLVDNNKNGDRNNGGSEGVTGKMIPVVGEEGGKAEAEAEAEANNGLDLEFGSTVDGIRVVE
ncbi:hypothetical protein A1O1_00077 [Capronia coronata CBS 617.96]|uniref:CAP-Gly domain-containing protein n=1 Tax=Capronia coronata CBS 617.96 TaxID=1182541 RepID=W9ZKD0_9EURO|nr:uncharacterized protein A1O1_00077 [Capronia coronata CBS 617.96]EXJ94959.1 hypothetical protein A1O1_00077 [Capronia coronata CBS 617.96]